MSDLWLGLALAAVAAAWCPGWSWWLRRHARPADGDDLMAVNEAVELDVCEAIWALPERSPR